MRNLFLLIFMSLFFVSCSDSSPGTVSYKYQITGTAPVAFSERFLESEEREFLSSTFILKWNETSGVISGIYTNQSTNENLTVSGTATASGRTMKITLKTPADNVAALEITLPTGDLSGSVNGTLKTLDSNNAVLETSNISVEAQTTGTTTGGSEEEDNDGDGQATGMGAYKGVYGGTVTETIDASNKCNFVQNTFRLAISKYDIMTYYTNFVDEDSTPASTIVSDTSTLDPAAFDHTKAIGYTALAGTTIGSISIKANTQIQGVFATSGATKTFVGTLRLFETDGGSATCTYSLNLTKQ